MMGKSFHFSMLPTEIKPTEAEIRRKKKGLASYPFTPTCPEQVLPRNILTGIVEPLDD